MRKTEVIRVRNGGVDKSPIHLSVSQGDDVVWESQDDSYTVEFVGTSPFVRPDPIRVPARGRGKSGPLRNGVQLGRYSYDVVSAATAAGKGADPDVDIVA